MDEDCSDDEDDSEEEEETPKVYISSLCNTSFFVITIHFYQTLSDNIYFLFIKKAETRRKRAHEAAPAPKTPVSAKKAKAAEATPKKTGKDNDSLKALQTVCETLILTLNMFLTQRRRRKADLQPPTRQRKVETHLQLQRRAQSLQVKSHVVHARSEALSHSL